MLMCTECSVTFDETTPIGRLRRKCHEWRGCNLIVIHEGNIRPLPVFDPALPGPRISYIPMGMPLGTGRFESQEPQSRRRREDDDDNSILPVLGAATAIISGSLFSDPDSNPVVAPGPSPEPDPPTFEAGGGDFGGGGSDGSW
jgi:hypothetical protein